MQPLPTGTITFLFTDIEGSTRLLNELGGKYGDVLAIHNRLLRSAFDRHGGHVVDTQGDSFFVAFAGAREALSAAIEGQRSLGAEAWPGGRAVRVRMGLHTGEPTVVESTYIGMDVHRAARIGSAAHGGQVVLSRTSWDLVSPDLPDDVWLKSLGEHRLKDIDAPEEIYQVVAPGLLEDFPALKSLEVPTNLPRPPTELVGREFELLAVSELLLRPGVRLVTLSGSGGSGKTRLSIEIGRRVLDSFRDGVFFVDLTSIDAPELIASEIVKTIGIQGSGDQAPESILASHLGDRRALLLLDNFEHVLDAAPLVGELLAHAPNLRVLVTSRAPLHLQGEHEYALPPLSLPAASDPFEAIAASEAVSLFVRRGQAVLRSFVLDESNAPLIAEICNRLDGLPLALELAAARVKLLPPRAMLERLEKRLPLLSRGAQDLPVRQQTLKSTIDWSYELLDVDLQTFFVHMSVFAGGCSLEAVESVIELSGSGDVLSGLESLVDHSLIVQTEDALGNSRFRMLTTIRNYAQERLDGLPEAIAVRDRHAAYYAQVAVSTEELMRGPQEAEAFEVLDTEIDNIRAALSWLLADKREGAAKSAERALTMAGALNRYWYGHGRPTEGSEWLAATLEAATDAPLQIRGTALHGLGVLLEHRRDYERASRVLKEALDVLERAGDRSGVAAALNSLGILERSRMNPAAARSLFQQAHDIRVQLGDEERLATTLCNLGVCALDMRDLPLARSLFEQGLAIDRTRGDEWGIAVGSTNLGAVLLESGDTVGSGALIRKALTLFHKLGDTDGVAESLEGLVGVHAAEGQPIVAARLSAAAARQRADHGIAIVAADEVRYGRYLDSARAQVGSEAFERASKEGAEMTLEQAVRYATEEHASVPENP